MSAFNPQESIEILHEMHRIMDGQRDAQEYRVPEKLLEAAVRIWEATESECGMLRIRNASLELETHSVTFRAEHFISRNEAECCLRYGKDYKEHFEKAICRELKQKLVDACDENRFIIYSRRDEHGSTIIRAELTVKNTGLLSTLGAMEIWNQEDADRE